MDGEREKERNNRGERRRRREEEEEITFLRFRVGRVVRLVREA